jgi:hypothetical protein
MVTRRPSMKVSAPGVEDGVTTLELFFDLVFVFAVTQLTGLIVESDGARGYLRAGLVLSVTWWMYEAMFRRRLAVGPVVVLGVGAPACLLTVPLGTAVSGLAQLAGLTIVLLVVLLVRVARERGEDQWPYESESTAADSP